MLDDIFKVILIETFTWCNRECWFCMYGQERYKNEKPNMIKMSEKNITSIIDDLGRICYSGRISWFRINEPLMDKRIFEIIRDTKLKVPNCHQTLTTNGDLLSQRVLDRLVESGLSHLSISVYDDETFKRVMRLNLPDDTAIKDRRADFKWDNRGGNINSLVNSSQNKYIDSECHRPSTAINVVPNGDVVLCCSDMYGDEVMGNINENSLVDIWFGEKFQRYRDKLRNGRRGLNLCQNCDYEGTGHSVYGRANNSGVLRISEIRR